ncbi:MAG: lactate racemase domain-containing protein [Sphaerochaetaceae bacterium]
MNTIRSDGKVSQLLRGIPIPRMFHVSQSFPRGSISCEEIPSRIQKLLSNDLYASKVQSGMRIAITVGSRGIRNINVITKAIVDWVKSRGAYPFIVPAMGSHGGATAEGQLEVLAHYQITEETMGCPILSSMEVVELGVSSCGKRVFIDKNAFESNGIIVSCRIKPHNAFRGPIESGICKMLTVGLGKQAGASIVHSDGMNHMARNIPEMAKVVLEKAPVLFAVATIEDAYDETYRLEPVLAEEVLKREPELLRIAFSQMPSLLIKETDVLVVDQIGKNFSGTGVDPNITGTFSTPYASGGVKVQRTCMLNLTEESDGNALGIGLADVITQKIYHDMDVEKMYPNCITSTVLASARIPCIVANDKEAIQLCIRTCPGLNNKEPRIVRIPNSLRIGQIMLSESYYKDVINGKYPKVKALDTPLNLIFDEEGTLLTPWLN